MSISPMETFISLTEDVALLTKIFIEKKENLVKFMWFVKYFLMFLQPILIGEKGFFISTCCHLFYYGGLLM